MKVIKLPKDELLFSSKVRQLNNYPEFKTDNSLQILIQILKTGSLPEDKKQHKRFIDKFKDFSVENGDLYYSPKRKNDDDTYLQNINLKVIKPSEREDVLKSIYNNPSRGLGTGINQFYYQICRSYLNITRKETTDFLKRQGDYQIGLIKYKKINNPIVAKTSNERWGVDNVDMTRYKENGYIGFLTIVDYFSKKVWAFGVKSFESKPNYNGLISICKKEDTYPQIIQVDNGATFYGDFKTMMEEHNKENPNETIKIIYTSPHTPTANGLVERMNRELRKKIRAGFIKNNNLKWVNMLSIYCDNINNQRSTNTKYTPNQIWTKGYIQSNTTIPIDEKENDFTDINIRRDTLKNKLLENSFKQFKNQQKERDFKKGDYVRLKLSSYAGDTKLYTQVKSRDKDIKNKKYNVINYSLHRFRILKIIPSNVNNQSQLKSLENHLPKAELFYRLQNKYKLEEEIAPNDFIPYRIEIQKKRQQTGDDSINTFMPSFYASELQYIPQNTTPYSVSPSTSNIEKLNTFNYQRKDILTREAEKELGTEIEIPKEEPKEYNLRSRSKPIEPRYNLRSRQ
jgi:hypothetical protein